MPATVHIDLRPVEVIAVREVLLQHVLWGASHDLHQGIDTSDLEATREALGRVTETALMIDHVGWAEGDVEIPTVSLVGDPAVLAAALDDQASRLAGEMGENNLDHREGHSRMTLLYGLVDRLEAAA